VSGPSVHPTAIVSPEAKLADDVLVGPYAIIGPRVTIGAGTTVGPHSVIEGNTTIGDNNRIFHFVSMGAVPQDLKYHGEDSCLVIGNRNTIREFATLHVGTEGGGLVTRIGNDNLLMNYTHVAHDCVIGNCNVLANVAQLAGHVTLQDFTVIGAAVGIHQFVRIGESALLGAGSMVSQDVPPFCNATGDRARLHGLNTVGLRRRGFSSELISAIKHAYRIMFQSELKSREAVARARAERPGVAEVDRFLDFILSSERGICR
jgi:UDP-N-acetylglucosamine acyltransferase